MREYPSRLTDTEWEIIRPLHPDCPMGFRGRPREHSRRSILNGIFYIVQTGGAWRIMQHDLPPLEDLPPLLPLVGQTGPLRADPSRRPGSGPAQSRKKSLDCCDPR
ncbi:transposase [Haloferula luteola]|uniref:transposase n=1 Tax=Haloferula luteola TaxID=595692 RepID=UPI00161A5ABC